MPPRPPGPSRGEDAWGGAGAHSPRHAVALPRARRPQRLRAGYPGRGAWAGVPAWGRDRQRTQCSGHVWRRAHRAQRLGPSRASLARKQWSAPRGPCGRAEASGPTLRAGGWVGRAREVGAEPPPALSPRLSLARGCVLGLDGGGGSRGGLGVPAPGSGQEAWEHAGQGGGRVEGEAGWECKQREPRRWVRGDGPSGGAGPPRPRWAV